MNTDRNYNDVIKARFLAYEVLFQSLIHELDENTKQKVKKTIEDNFSAFEKGTTDESAKIYLHDAKLIAARISGAKL